jgi:outer membrane protein
METITAESMAIQECGLKHGVNLILLAGAIALGGCANLDPWGRFDGLPASRSHSFEAEITEGEPVEASSPDPASELSGRTLSLGECVTIALERNPRTTESWQAIRATAARVGRAKAAYLPTVGLTSSAARGNAAELDSKVDPGTQNRYEAVFGVRWLLFDGGGREARVDAAAAAVLVAGFRHNTALQDVVLEVVETYYSLLAVRSFRELAVETVRQRDYQLRMAEARYRAGVVAKSDVLRAQTEKADADLNLVRAKNAVHVGKGRLAGAMGLRVSTDFQIADVSEADYTQELADIESLLNEAASNRPELKIALAEVRIQEAAVRVAKSRYLPAVAFDTGFGWLGRSLLPSQEQWSVGVALDLPLFTGFDRTYQMHASKADLARTIAQREGVLRGVELEVWTAYWQTIDAGEAVGAAKRFVASAAESARVAEGEYKNGTGTIIGLIDAQTAWTTARVRLIQTQLGWHTAMARFERAVGRSLPDAGNQPVKKVNDLEKET